MGAFASFCAPPSLRPRTHPQAELADRDFTADRERVIVISTGAVEQVDLERAAAERAAMTDISRSNGMKDSRIADLVPRFSQTRAGSSPSRMIA